MKILGIETSCDETAISLIEAKKNKINILSNIISSQWHLYKKYGGVVPELSAREHLKNILPVLKMALKPLGGNSSSLKKIDFIAVTLGPGLLISLMVGVETAKLISRFFNKPLIGINHLEGHLYSSLFNQKFNFPILALIASGGHTELILVPKINQYKIIGQTLDDAAGECLDKTAKLLKLNPPTGAEIEKMAKKGKDIFQFPRPMIKSKNFDFSFSGLKTAVLYKLKDLNFEKRIKKSKLIKLAKKQKQQFLGKKKIVHNLAASIQEAVIEVLVKKTILAAKKFKIKTIAIGGGVSANKKLKEELKREIKFINQQLKNGQKIKFFFPSKNLATDNGAMIAIAGYFKLKNLSQKEIKNLKENWKKLKADPKLSL